MPIDPLPTLSPPARALSARSAVESGMGNALWTRSEMLERLQKREALLRATSLAASRFLTAPWRDSLSEALGALGEALGASRLWIAAREVDLDSQITDAGPVCGAWEAPDAPDADALIDGFSALRLDAAWNDETLWRELFSSGQSLQLSGETGDDADSDSSEFPARRGAMALMVTAIGSGVNASKTEQNGAWGALICEDCRAPRVWDAAEIEAMQLLADLIGAAIARESSEAALRRSESGLRGSETELRALFGAMRDAIFVLDRDGRHLKVVANDPDLLYRPVTDLLGKTLGEVMEADRASEFLSVVRDVLASQSLRSFEYPLEIEGQPAWFRASVTPLSDDAVLWVAHDVTLAHSAAESLRESEALFRLLAENSTDKIARFSMDGKFIYASPSVKPLLGFTPEEMIGTHCAALVHPDDQGIVAASLARLQGAQTKPDAMVYRIRRKNGEYIWFETTSRLVFDPVHHTSEVHAVSRDVSARRIAEEGLREAEAKYRSIFENAVEGIFQSSPDGHYIDANPSLARIYGYDSPRELLDQLVDISGQLYLEPARREEFVAAMESGAVTGFESQIHRKDGEIIWISENARSVCDETGQLSYYEGTVEDITARKNAEGQLLHDALHDKLTGLSNRALYMDRLEQSFSRLKRHPEARFAALFLDFDRFKTINDSLGHLAGDQLLIAVSRRIADCLRPGDTVSRLGGDEFAILLEDVADVAGAIIVAERIQIAMTAPFRIVGQEVFTSTSIGIALANADYQHAEELIRDADMAMYRAKALGKARHHVFDVGMHKSAVALLQLETDMRHAIERDEFRVFYQPIISLQSGEITGFEALVRWQHSTRGLVSPAEFIPVAEETGWIVPIGSYVLDEACRQLAQWRQRLSSQTQNSKIGVELLSMSVNLSSRQFSQPDLLLEIKTVLARHALPAACLKLEITESALMERAQEITDRLLELRQLGVKLSLDDFGTGYSSLSYLHRFPLDTLKIDRSFIARMHEDKSGGWSEDREIVRTIVALGKNLGMNIVAEGIEDGFQLAALRGLGCNSGQGFFFAKPLPAKEALELMQSAPVW